LSPSQEQQDGAFERNERGFSATHNGFDVYCAVRIANDDDEGRERLVRYCARPPFALERLELLKDGRIAYRMKTPRRGSSHRVMTPMELMARLAILVPPPFFPLTRYHGVLAARSSWRVDDVDLERRLVTPKPPRDPKRAKPCNEPDAATKTAAPAPAPSAKPPRTRALRRRASPAARRAVRELVAA
jgi:pyruvate/2-oxoglutarate dehydrogenase complex dihydrolipoamide acyltransferase (E2) component